MELGSQDELWDHVISSHFYDDLAVEVELGCPAPGCSFSPPNLEAGVKHLGRQHGRAEQLYTSFIMSTQLLQCSLCAMSFPNIYILKKHLGADHFHRELTQGLTRLGNGLLMCGLCTGLDPTTSQQAALQHLATAHNTVEELYRKEVARGQLECQLCGWYTCRYRLAPLPTSIYNAHYHQTSTRTALGPTTDDFNIY